MMVEYKQAADDILLPTIARWKKIKYKGENLKPSIEYNSVNNKMEENIKFVISELKNNYKAENRKDLINRIAFLINASAYLTWCKYDNLDNVKKRANGAVKATEKQQQNIARRREVLKPIILATQKSYPQSNLSALAEKIRSSDQFIELVEAQSKRKPELRLRLKVSHNTLAGDIKAVLNFNPLAD